MELQLVSKEVAILAKELGFDWKCSTVINYNPPRNSIGTYSYVSNSEITEKYQYTLPEQELLAKWLRDVHKLYVEITRDMSNWVVDICNLQDIEVTFVGDDILILINKTFKTYEDALEGGLLAVLNGIKKNLKVD